MQHITPTFRLIVSAMAVAILTGCASSSHRAPVETRAGGAKAMPVAQFQPQRLPPGAENAGKPGYYTIKPGDTLIRIGLETGQSWRDLAAWNGIENPNRIEVGQVVRIVPPVAEGGAVAAAAPASAALSSGKPVTSARVEPRPVEAKPVAAGVSANLPPSPGTVASGAGAGAGAGASTPAMASAPDVTPRTEVKASAEPGWIWPANGPTIAQFEEGKRKGLVIGGKAGDPVVAAGDGRVVYAGSGLRGYGNLVIIKHGGDYLTAYAHNQALLVKEDQAVRKGQKIAEMGATDAERVQLHFEIRKQGKPIDPARQLPSR